MALNKHSDLNNLVASISRMSRCVYFFDQRNCHPQVDYRFVVLPTLL